MMNWFWAALIGVVILLGVLVVYLFRPLAHKPEPAALDCLDIAEGSYQPLETPGHIYGVGLSYAGHIRETASEFDPEQPPPIFEKSLRSLAVDGDEVRIPGSDAIFEAAEAIEPGLAARLRDRFETIPSLLDYETELAFVLLEDIDPTELRRDDFAPSLGFLIANDLSARSLAVLGEGQPNRYEYWGASKSFPGFLPTGTRVWIPARSLPRGVPCVEIQTTVNGELRQKQSTRDLIYTPVEMLRFVHAKYPDRPLRRGDMVLTGTPSGVAMQAPRALVRLANLLGFDRYKKLKAAISGDTSRFLREGDLVAVEGEGLGRAQVTIRATVGPTN
jgi:2-keto-4-pentenoate hydratase/2-oxohepta-3-ene-1,7-dioic acid hydratase in catechol pathway